MARTSFNLNASSVVVLPNGSVGGILTFANLVISVSVMEIMSASTLNSSCRSVVEWGLARLVGTMRGMERRKCWVVQFAETINKIINSFDLDRIVYYLSIIYKL